MDHNNEIVRIFLPGGGGGHCHLCPPPPRGDAPSLLTDGSIERSILYIIN